MRKMLVLTTLLFGLLLAGCSEDSNNNGSQAGNGGDTGLNTTPGLSIKASYSRTTVTFNADLYGTTLGEGYNFKWDFGDSQTATTANPEHTYSSEGQYTVTVSVTDKDGNEVGSAILMININLSGKIVDPTLEMTGNEDPLTFTFETKARSDDGAPLIYTWTFENNLQEVGGSVMTHTFSKYGTTYNPKLRVENRISGANFEKTIVITTKKPNFTISCSGSGLTATCSPVIDGMPNGFEDAAYTWSFGGVQRTTTGNEPATYTFDSPGSKEISVIGTSSKVEGNFTANTTVSFSNQISLDTIECEETGARLLEYRCSVNPTLSDEASRDLTYKWTFAGNSPTSTNENTATYAFTKFPPTNNPSYEVSVTVGFVNGSQETASTSRRINIAHPTVTISRGTSSSSTAASFNATLSHAITGANYRWIITGPNNYNYQVEGVDKTNTGNVELQYEGTYTANLTVSHGSFASGTINATPLQATISAAVEDAEISCTKVDGMTYSCTTNARGYATVNGQRQEVPLEYQWRVARGDGQESYGPTTDPKFTQKTFSQTFKKYDGTYRVNLTLIPEGTNKTVDAPQKTYKTDNIGVTITKPASVRAGVPATFSVSYGNLVNGVQPKDTDITWTIAGKVQSSKNQSITHIFNNAGTYNISVSVNASNFGSTLTSNSSVEVITSDVKPEHITGATLVCTTTDSANNDIKKQCRLDVTMATNNDGVTQNDILVRVIPVGTRGQADSPAIEFAAGQTKDVIFDWPYVNIAEITDREATRQFNAYAKLHVYDKKGKKIKELPNQEFNLNLPKVSYELQHRVNTAQHIIGTGAKIKLLKTQAPFRGQAQWEWKMYFKGLNGGQASFFEMEPGNEKNFIDQMINARFAGSVKGNPYELQSGFGVKISAKPGASILSKPLYLYGVNTPQGIQEDQANALGNYLGGRAWMAPEGTMAWEGRPYRDMNGHGFLASFVVRVDTRYKVDGFDLYCLIGLEGYKNKTSWALPGPAILRAHPTQKDRYSELVGAYYGKSETRKKGEVYNGNPPLPAAAGTSLMFKEPPFYYNFAEYGLRAAHVGYMLTPGQLSSCYELKRFPFTNSGSAVYDPWDGRIY